MKMVVPIPKRTMQLLCLLDPVWVAQRWVSLAGLACSRSGCAGAGQWHQGRRNKAVNTEALCWWGFLTAAAKQKPGSPFLNKFVIHPEVIVAFLRQCLLLSTKLHLNKDTWQRFWRQTRTKASILLYVQLLFDCAACLFFCFYWGLLFQPLGHCNSGGCQVFEGATLVIWVCSVCASNPKDGGINPTQLVSQTVPLTCQCPSLEAEQHTGLMDLHFLPFLNMHILKLLYTSTWSHSVWPLIWTQS